MINSFDIETLNNNNCTIAYCVCVIYNNKNYFFYGLNCIQMFILFLEKEKSNDIILYAHNLTFDGSFIIQNIDTTKHKINGIFYNNNIYKISILLNNKKNITLKCSYKFYPFSLESAHKKLNTTKKISINIEKIDINNYIEKKNEIIKYCLNDALITKEIVKIYYKIFNEFFNFANFNWKKKCLSQSSISYAVFKHVFNEYRIETKLHTSIDEEIRKAYHGGRCEVFGNAKSDENIHYFDFKGMYAQKMHDDFCHGKHIKTINPKSINKPGFYMITFKSNEEIPILPHKSINNKLMFTNGIISGLYWWEEILLFENNGGIILKLHYSITFENYNKCLEKFTKNFTLLREKSKSHDVIAKNTINSLYGRFGMSINKTQTILTTLNTYNDFKNKKNITKEYWIKGNNIGVITCNQNIEAEHTNSNVIIAATIASKARITLYNAFKSIEKIGGRVLYSDTDSIASAHTNSLTNYKIDNLSWEESRIDNKFDKAVFCSSKMYGYIINNKETIKMKGISSNRISFNDLEDMFYNEKSTKTKITYFKKSNYIIKIENIEKIIDVTNYNKRLFINDKKTTKPFIKDGIQYK